MQAANAAARTATLAEPSAEWLDIETPIYTIDATLQNPDHATTGVFTQASGIHPSKAGRIVMSRAVLDLLTLGL